MQTAGALPESIPYITTGLNRPRKPYPLSHCNPTRVYQQNPATVPQISLATQYQVSAGFGVGWGCYIGDMIVLHSSLLWAPLKREDLEEYCQPCVSYPKRFQVLNQCHHYYHTFFIYGRHFFIFVELDQGYQTPFIQRAKTDVIFMEEMTWLTRKWHH